MEGAKSNEQQVEAEEAPSPLQDAHPGQQPSDVEGADSEHDIG